MKPNRASMLNKAQLCVTELFTLFRFTPQNAAFVIKFKLPAVVTSPDQYSNHCHHK